VQTSALCENPNTLQEHQHKGCSIKASTVRGDLGHINAFNVNFLRRIFHFTPVFRVILQLGL